MHCRHCNSEQVRRNGHDRKGKQNYLCQACGRTSVESLEPNRLTETDHGYILAHYAEGLSIRAIARLLGNTTWFPVWRFLKKVDALPPAPSTPLASR